MNRSMTEVHFLGKLTAEQTGSLLEAFQRMGYYNPDPASLAEGLMDVSLKRFRKGEVLMVAGDSPNAFYIIHKGSVSVSKQVKGKDILVAKLGQYDVLGELALLEGRPRSATAIVLEDSELFQLSKWDFDFLMKTCDVFRQVIEALADERNRYNTQLQGD